MKVDVTKCHACHAKCRSDHDSASPEPAQCHKWRACHAKRRSISPVPRLPRKPKVHVAKCHACHAKCRGDHGVHWTQAHHQSQPSAISAPPATQNEGRCRQVPGLPRKTKVDVAKCQAYHAKRRSMSPSATPATQRAAATTASTGPKRASPVPQVPRQPRKTKVDVAKCHTYHTERRSMSPSATLPTQSAAATTASTGPKRVTRASPVP